jgi:hypothetical protein
MEKSVEKTKTRLRVNRYSVDKSDSRKRVGYSTISYDHLNDPEFYGTRGKKDQSESYNVLIHERWKTAEIVGLKVASCRGFKEPYLEELRTLENKLKDNLRNIESDFQQEISVLKHTISQMRR